MDQNNASPIRVQCGNCLDLMAALADKSIDHTITDPPFGVNVHQNQFDGGGGIKAKKTVLDFAPLNAAEIYTYAKEIVRVTKGWILVFCQAEMLGDWKAALQEAGAVYKRAEVWVKPDARPQLSGDRAGQGFEVIATAYGSTGKSEWNGRGKLGIRYASIPRGKLRLHPTQKPVALLEDLILDYTTPGDIILDPFAGAGTTGIACARWGRRSIGYELDPKYQQIATARIEEELRQLSIIRPIVEKMTQSVLSLPDPEPSETPESSSL